MVPPNSRPVADDAYGTPEDTPFDTPMPGCARQRLRRRWRPVDPSPVHGPDHGTAALDPDGSFVYTPASGFFGTDTFTYRAEDASSHSAETVVSLTVGNLIFADGFESGDITAWSSSVPH